MLNDNLTKQKNKIFINQDLLIDIGHEAKNIIIQSDDESDTKSDDSLSDNLDDSLSDDLSDNLSDNSDDNSDKYFDDAGSYYSYDFYSKGMGKSFASYEDNKNSLSYRFSLATKQKIRQYLNKVKFNILIEKKDLEYKNVIKKLAEEYNVDPLLIIIKFKNTYIKKVDTKYFTINNVSLWFKKINNFEKNILLEILDNIVQSIIHTDIKNVCRELEFFLFNYKKNINDKQIFVIDFLINYLDPKKELLNMEIHDRFQLQNFIDKKIVDKYNKAYNKILLDLESNNDFNIKKNYKILDIYMNTDNSKMIDSIIKLFDKIDILNSLQKILKKDSIKIKEQDVIKILNLLKNKQNILPKTIFYHYDIFDNLIKHNYLIALSIFNNYINIKIDMYDIKKYVVSILLSGKEKQIKYLIDSVIGKAVLEDYNIWDMILFDEELTKQIIKLGHQIPSNYFLERFGLNKNITKSFIFGQTYDYLDTGYYIRKNKKVLKKKSNIDMLYKNLCKFNIPLNDMIIANFINYVKEEDIIKFYNKTSDVNIIVPYMMYTKKYKLIDKLIELGIYSQAEYKKNFMSNLRKIIGNPNRTRKIGLVYRLFSSSIKYGVKPNNFLLSYVLKFGSIKMLNKLIRVYNKKINHNFIYNLVCGNRGGNRWIKRRFGTLIEHLKPYIKNYDKLFTDILFVEKIIKSYENITLEKLVEYKKSCPKLSINLFEEDYKYFYDESEANIYNTLNYIYENNLSLLNDKKINNNNDLLFTIDVNSMISYFSKYLKYIKVENRIIEIFGTNKFLKTFIPKETIYQNIQRQYYSNISETINLIKFYEKIGCFEHNLYTNTLVLIMTEGFDNHAILEYCYSKYPYLQSRTYKYLECVVNNLKKMIYSPDKLSKRKIKSRRNFNFNLDANKLICLQKIIDNIPKKNIIGINDINKYINIEEERPTNIHLLKDDSEYYFFRNLEKTPENDLFLDLWINN
jgi:hypothetical protein